MPLPETVKQNLYGMGLTKLTEIQIRAFDPIMRGKNFVGRSHTGSGKTIAYLLPVLERVRHEKMTEAHSVLILVPTRELCQQVGGAVLSLGVATDVALVYGGPALHSQEELVRLGARVVVATPGRCARLIERGALETKSVQVLVIDEADAMLGPDFAGRVERVQRAVAKPGLQTVLFSAALPPEALTAAKKHLADYELVDLVDRGGVRASGVVQQVAHLLCKVPASTNLRSVDTARMRVLLHVLTSRMADSPGSRCLLFVDSTAEASALLSHPALAARARSVHAQSTASDRDFVLNAFANREFDVLIATDVVARGVDFSDITLVLQLRPPRDGSQYVHRAGRTGRGGQSGTVVTFYEPKEHAHVQRMREATRHRFKIEATPGPDDIHHQAVSRILEDMQSVQPEDFDPFVADAAKLLEQHGPQVLATAMAVLDGRHADLSRAGEESRSMLSGRSGFVCLLAHDPNHEAAQNTEEVRRMLGSLLPGRAGHTAIGRVQRTTCGWALDMDAQHGASLVEDLRCGRRSAPFEVTVARRMPRIVRKASDRARRAPWSSSRRQALKMRRGKASNADDVWKKGDPRIDGKF